jgi:hypothetical protein
MAQAADVTLSEEAVQGLVAQTRGPVLRPGDPGYDDARALWNGLIDRGRAHYAATPDAAPAIFAEQHDGLTRLVAQNVSVEIRPSTDVELVAVLNDYPAVPVDGGVQLASATPTGPSAAASCSRSTSPTSPGLAPPGWPTSSCATSRSARSSPSTR